MAARSLILASQSPRRSELLRQSGFRPRVLVPDVDDGTLRSGNVSPAAWVEALAYLKGRAAFELLDDCERVDSIVISADTLVVDGDTLIGKPRSRDEAEASIRRLMNREHRVVSGVCVIDAGVATRFSDAATVRFGEIGAYELEEYLDSGDWQGKAGGYNLSERIESGWPISFDGDSTTIMGLPMGKLGPLLRDRLGIDAFDFAA